LNQEERTYRVRGDRRRVCGSGCVCWRGLGKRERKKSQASSNLCGGRKLPSGLKAAPPTQHSTTLFHYSKAFTKSHTFYFL